MGATLRDLHKWTGRTADEPEYLRIPAVMGRYGLSRSGIYRAAAEGKINLIKCGRATLVEAASVRAFLAGLPRATVGGAGAAA